MRYREIIGEDLPTPESLVDINSVCEYAYGDIDWSGGAGEGLIEDYCSESGIDPDDDYVDVHSEDFRGWFKGWCEDRAWNAWGEFSHLFDGAGNATLYRVITAPADWKPDPARHPGIYWSWDKNAADAHWGDFSGEQVKWRITGVINMRDVDWTATLGQNVQPDYESEKEIRIKENAPVKITNIERLGQAQ